MSKILKILNEITSEPGSNKKMDILRSYKDEPLLKEVIYQAMSPRVNFYIKKIPTYDSMYTEGNPSIRTLREGLDGINKLSERVLTGNEAIEHLRNILTTLSTANAKIIEKIIAKDLRIGMGSTNINKVFPKLIEDTPYMGAKSFSSELAKKICQGPAVSQIKMDGRYLNGIIKNGKVILESRQGENNYIHADFAIAMKTLPDCVLNGELTIPGTSRYESNGIISSLVSIAEKHRGEKDITKELKKFKKEHGMNMDEALAKVTYTVWDMINLDEYYAGKSGRSYNDRLEVLNETIKNLTGVNLIIGREVDSYIDAMEHFQEALAAGEEGTILKSLTAGWKDGKPNWQVKMKLEMDVDLRIKGFQTGTGKNSHVYSALIVESDDGLIKTKVPGMKEDMMDYITANSEKLLDTIVEVKSCGLSKSKNGETYSLLHPVFKRLRDDKNTCDTLESVKEIENMAKLLK